MRKNWKPVDLTQITTYPISERKNKVSIRDFATPTQNHDLRSFFRSLPKILKANELLELAELIITARRKNRAIIFMLGGHVIKCGLSPIVIDLMRMGFVSAFAFNGATAIHDFEIAMIGETSEDVAETIQDGSFGMADETGLLMNEAIRKGAEIGVGFGRSLGEKLREIDAPHSEFSILMASLKLGVPITVHVAIGNDIIHQHPAMSGSAIGEASFLDFRLLASIVSDLNDGGVVINFGSAVILPEVFLKALTIVRNLGSTVKNFTTANFDMTQHYRPIENVIRRPTNTGGCGFAFTGHHEIMIPLLAVAIKNSM